MTERGQSFHYYQTRGGRGRGGVGGGEGKRDKRGKVQLFYSHQAKRVID